MKCLGYSGRREKVVFRDPDRVRTTAVVRKGVRDAEGHVSESQYSGDQGVGRSFRECKLVGRDGNVQGQSVLVVVLPVCSDGGGWLSKKFLL